MNIEIQVGWTYGVLFAMGLLLAIGGTLDSLKITKIAPHIKSSPISMLVLGYFGLIIPFAFQLNNQGHDSIRLSIMLIGYFFLFAGVILEKRARKRVAQNKSLTTDTSDTSTH